MQINPVIRSVYAHWGVTIDPCGIPLRSDGERVDPWDLRAIELEIISVYSCRSLLPGSPLRGRS